MLRTLLIMLVAGWAAGGTPFRGDQALFALYARDLARGQVLYQDRWDVANPGIFAFYTAAGSLFGFDEDGIHFAEWLWFLAFVLLLGWAMVLRFKLETWPQTPALLVGVWYFATSCADPSHLTKSEGLVAFPLFISLWAASHGRDRRWLIVAGLAGGVVVLFKLAFALLLLAGWLPLLMSGGCQPLELNHNSTPTPRSLSRLLILPVGVLVAYLPAFLFIPFQALVDCLYFTPQEILKSAEPAGFVRLATSVRWFAETSTPLLILAAAGSFLMYLDRLVRSYLLVLPAAIVVVLIQRWSWWSYHFLLVSLPLAVLAAYTWPAVQARIQDRLPRRRERLAVYSLIALSFFAPLGHLAVAWLRILPHRAGITATDRSAARLGSGRAYHIAAEEAKWLATAPPGPIFIAGDPLILWLSGRPAGSRFHGWSLELLTPNLWQTLIEDLSAHPPTFLYIDRRDLGTETMIRNNAPQFLLWIDKNYDVHHVSPHGTWYGLK